MADKPTPTAAQALRQAHTTLQTAHRFIGLERAAFAAANRNPDGTFDAGETAELADYDAALSEMRAAIENARLALEAGSAQAEEVAA